MKKKTNTTKKKPNRRDLTERNLGPIKKLEKKVRQLEKQLEALKVALRRTSK
jgi:hypothetical protein